MNVFIINLEVKTDRPHDFRNNGTEEENIGIFANLPYHTKDMFDLVYPRLNYYTGSDDISQMVLMITESCKHNRDMISVLSSGWFNSNYFRYVSIRLTIKKYNVKSFSETRFPSGIR